MNKKKGKAPAAQAAPSGCEGEADKGASKPHGDEAMATRTHSNKQNGEADPGGSSDKHE